MEPRPHVTCRENFVKFGRVVCEMREQTDVQTQRPKDSAPFAGWIIKDKGNKGKRERQGCFSCSTNAIVRAVNL